MNLFGSSKGKESEENLGKAIRNKIVNNTIIIIF